MFRASNCLSAIVLMAVGSFTASTTRAQSVADARRHYLEAEFEEAAADFEAMLTRPSLDAAVAVECHSHLMVMCLLHDDSAAARMHARYALALDRVASAPAGAPPEAAELMNEIRSSTTQQVHLSIDSTTRSDVEGVATYGATLRSSPEGLFASMRLRCVSGDVAVEEDGDPPYVELSLRPVDRVSCRASAYTGGGAVLLRSRRSFVLGVHEAVHEDSGISGWVWVGVGAGILAVAATVLSLFLILPSDQATLGPPTIE